MHLVAHYLIHLQTYLSQGVLSDYATIQYFILMIETEEAVYEFTESKDNRFHIDQTSITHFRVESMPNWRRPGDVCYLEQSLPR